MKEKKNIVNTICSHFGLDKKGFNQSSVDFFDANLNKDNLAFFDYNRVMNDKSSQLGRTMSDKLRVFLLALMTQALRENQKDGLKLLDGIAEINDTRLGYSANSSYGLSIGKVMKPLFFDSLSFLRKSYKADQISFNAIRLGIKDISYDRISDICVSLCLIDLVSFTQEQANLHGIPLTTKKRFSIFDITQKIWQTKSFELPEYQGKTIVFIPKRYVSSKVKAICTLDQFISYGFFNFLAYSEKYSHLKRKDGKNYLKDFEEYLKKHNIPFKDIARDLLSNHKNILDDFESKHFLKIEELSTEELVKIANS
ncbi:hypothetical protein ORI89_05435 [Sphingobacterium sp. UT-1RO-CII-1]|uniref:hypothetical protein n=1 Tax=Sphingobacterium sp. UT-1RO-CII-1 TaxID=2995225 RepID=UPI00227AD8EC|nr:hypothetical protein [Sphingobacterium sp. UT-1RO-CII-1]MCY4779082.1 hypothetical protein [Sphingobacterium sp. UT-1RO-CII-1]